MKSEALKRAQKRYAAKGAIKAAGYKTFMTDNMRRLAKVPENI